MIYSKYPGRAVSLLVVLPLILSAQLAQDNAVALKNWATPLYWHPNAAERAAGAKPAPQFQLAPDAVSPDALTFVAITPCRLVDTRGAVGFNGVSPFDGPSIPAGTPGITTFPVQSVAEASAPCGAIPSIAEAYSLNLVVIPHGGQPVGFVTLWPAGLTQPVVATLNDNQGLIVGNAAIVAAGSPSGGISVFNSGPAVIDLVIDMNGYFAAPTDLNGNTAIGVATLAVNTGLNNTATGASAMNANTSGVDNTANGFEALTSNVSGNDNTATGFLALATNNIGGANTANGFQALWQNISGSGDAAFGFQALAANTASSNTGLGYLALTTNTTGTGNTASGYEALQLNLVGADNTASGYGALLNNTASFNTASGYQALQGNTSGIGNTATGNAAMNANTTGQFNTADGDGAGSTNVSGNNNTAIGYLAASVVPIDNSDSVYINSLGTVDDLSGSISIGTQAAETGGTIQIGSAQTGGTFIAGISGATAASGVEVLVSASGQLGTILSSGRFKEQIVDMGDSSSKLLQLRPVSFYYKPQYDDGSHLPQYGLIAEEVAKVYPEMVAYDKHGEILSVKYQLLAPMLLNEWQKQAAQNLEQAQDIRSLKDRLAALEAGLPKGAPADPGADLQPVH